MNPYQVLGVSQDVNLEVLKAAYRRLARENHPDSAQDDETREAATIRMAAINAAWHVLSDPEQRAALDTQLRFERVANTFREKGIRPTPPPTPAPAHKTTSIRPTSRKTQHATRKARGTKVMRTTTAAHHIGAGRSPKAASKNTRPIKLSSQAKLAEAKRLFYEQKQPDAALTLCLAVLRTDFRSIAARELLSEIYMAQGQPHRAFALLEQALMLQPTNAALVRKLNQISNSSGRLNPASNPQRPSSAFRGAKVPRTPSSQLSSRAVSVKHSVLGVLWAHLVRLTVGGK